MTAIVQLAAYKGEGGLFNAGIRKWTGSEYSHCEVVIYGRCYSSSIRDKGVRSKLITLDPYHWDVIDLPWADPLVALAWFALHEGDPYGFRDFVLSQMLNIRQDGRGAFCSEACAAMIGLPNPTSYSPKTLVDLCRHQNEKYEQWRIIDDSHPDHQFWWHGSATGAAPAA